jgi:hypothetical protein
MHVKRTHMKDIQGMDLSLVVIVGPFCALLDTCVELLDMYL